MSELTAAELERLRSGDEQAFTALVQTYHNRLVEFARPLVGDTWADEVVQESWISVYQGLGKFAGRSTVKTWLFTIVRNTALSRLRKERRLVSLEQALERTGAGDIEALLDSRFNGAGRWQDVPGNWGSQSADAELEQQQLEQCIDQAIRALSPQHQTVLYMRDTEQLSLDDICNILELNNSNVRVMLHRARLAVREAVDTYMETGNAEVPRNSSQCK